MKKIGRPSCGRFVSLDVTAAMLADLGFDSDDLRAVRTPPFVGARLRRRCRLCGDRLAGQESHDQDTDGPQ